MKVSTQKSVRDQLNALLTDAYTIIDPLATPITKQDSTETIAWKTEWQRMKDMGLAPNKNFTRYKISCFLFGSDSKKTQYKPDRCVKNILETIFSMLSSVMANTTPTNMKIKSTKQIAMMKMLLKCGSMNPS